MASDSAMSPPALPAQTLVTRERSRDSQITNASSEMSRTTTPASNQPAEQYKYPNSGTGDKKDTLEPPFTPLPKHVDSGNLSLLESAQPSSVSTVDGSEPEHETSQPGVVAEDAVDQQDPQERLTAFDWDGLFNRHRETMSRMRSREDHLVKDFNTLCQYFGTWALAGSTSDEERCAKRLKTQAAFVQLKEHELEQKRERYVRVIDAFKSALELLGD